MPHPLLSNVAPRRGAHGSPAPFHLLTFSFHAAPSLRCYLATLLPPPCHTGSLPDSARFCGIFFKVSF